MFIYILGLFIYIFNVYLHSRFVYLHSAMFIYKNFRKFEEFWTWELKFRFVYKHWSVYLHFQCLFTFLLCLFTFPMFIYKIFRKFKALALNFSLFTNIDLFIYIFNVYLHFRSVYLHLQCLCTQIFENFQKLFVKYLPLLTFT